jgi:hypothetical protein
MQIGSDLGLSPVANSEQFFLIIKKFLARFSRELLVLG